MVRFVIGEDLERIVSAVSVNWLSSNPSGICLTQITGFGSKISLKIDTRVAGRNTRHTSKYMGDKIRVKIHEILQGV